MDNWELYYQLHHSDTGGTKTVTGVPPLTFVSNGENLVDYRIDGASGGVGERTENIFDYDTITTGYRLQWTTGNLYADSSAIMSDYIEVEPNVTYSIDRVLFVYGYTSDKAYLGTYKNNGFIKDFATPVNTLTIPENCGYIRLMSYNNSTLTNISITQDTTMVSGNIAPTEYIPYGYKIPVICGGETTNIYLNELLGENESISMSDTGVSIPTTNGSNTLDIDTAIQPSNMYIEYKEGTTGFIKYLEYEYKVARNKED